MRAGLRAVAAALALLAAAPVAARKRPLAPGETVDLNRASVAELMRLPGIGRGRAEAIAAHREKRPFRAPAEVAQVKGIGRAWFEKHKAHLAAGGTTPAVKPDPAPLTPPRPRR